MLDLKLLAANPVALQTALAKKGFQLAPDAILALAAQQKATLQKIEKLRQTQNLASKALTQISDQTQKNTKIAELKTVAQELKDLTTQFQQTKKTLNAQLLTIPNPPLPDVPAGGENDFEILRHVGSIPEFNFAPRDHVILMTKLGLLNLERGVQLSGSRFYYLLGAAVQLEFALVNFVLQKLTAHGFLPTIGPTLVREAALVATGFFPAEREQIYAVNPTTATNPKGDDLFLIGTSEVSLAMLHAQEILTTPLPRRYLGFSTCYRREAGSYGKDTKGIFRVHQFDKLEMFTYTEPEKSAAEHEFLLECQEEILQDLGLPYRVVKIAARDLGLPAAKKYDLEVYLPSEKKYRELTSCSNCTDFQARRAQIRFTKNSQKEFVHTLNGTALAVSRALIALVENYQNADYSVTIPKVLRPFLGMEILKPKNNPCVATMCSDNS